MEISPECPLQTTTLINDGADFLKKYKTFSIQVISKINAEFLRVLYEILKKDIINLVSIIIADAAKSKILKKYLTGFYQES